MMKQLSLISLMVMLVCGLTLGVFAKESLAAPPTAETKTLKIGVMSNLTGPISTAAIPHTRGTQVAVDWINSKGGITIKGQKYLIELVVEDVKETVDTAITAVTKLVELHKVKFVVGLIGPTQILPVTSLTEQAKVIRSLWHGEGHPKELSADTPYTFRVSVIPRDFIVPLLKYQVKTYPEVKKISMLFIENPGAAPLFERTKKEAEALGLTVLGLHVYPVSTRDFYPLVTKVLASNPDAIYTDGLPHLMGGTLKAARELGFKGPIINLAPTCPNVVLKIAGKPFADNFIVGAPDVHSPKMTPMIKQIRTMLLDKYKEVTWDHIRGFDPTWWMIQAIEKAQSLDPTDVAKTWEKMNRIEATTGIGKMGGQQSYGINHVGVIPFAITRMVKGELEHVGWFTPEIP